MAATIMHRRGGGGASQQRRGGGTMEQESFDGISQLSSDLGPESFDDDNSNTGGYHYSNSNVSASAPNNGTTIHGDRKQNHHHHAIGSFFALQLQRLQQQLAPVILQVSLFLSTTVIQLRIYKQQVMAFLRRPDLQHRLMQWLQQPQNWILLTLGIFLVFWLGTMVTAVMFSPNTLSGGGHRTAATTTGMDFSSAFGPDGVEYHMIFSTGCSTFQDWQSYVFFYHAWKSGQPGHVTRIASGCSEDDEKLLRKMHREQIEIMSPEGRFHLHITPEFSTIKPGVSFKYFNKPFGLRHWMEHVLGYPKNTAHDDAIVMLLDPDQIVLRPFAKDYTNLTEVWVQPNLGKRIVERGQVFGQQYGFTHQWKTKVNMSKIFPNDPHTHINDVSDADAGAYYAAGPPYVGTAHDMYRIAKRWSDIVVDVHEEYPFLLAEMFAYCIAAAYENLPHQMATGFMVSDVTDSVGEGWELIDKYPKGDVCYIPQEHLPHVLHYCQRYNLGKWHFGKFRLRKDFISCESSLLMEPPPDVAAQYDFSVTPTNELTIWRHPHTAKRNGFMLCQIIHGLNDAAIFYKQHHCPVGTANFVKNYSFHDNMQVEQRWLDKVEEELKKKPLMMPNEK